MADVVEPRAPEKPAFGEKCNGCGFCCAAERCPLAIEFIGYGGGPCPAMEFEEGRFWCGLVRNAHQYIEGVKPWASPMIGEMLLPLFGTGCDADDFEPATNQMNKEG